MAAVIHSLWENGDTGLVILPGMVPLDDSIVRSEFTKFLGTSWGNIIDTEIDGQGSLAAQIDRESPALGSLGATRRVARSLFLETSPLQSGNQPGVDERALKVACTQPGEKPAVFGDAVGYLAAKSVHLYGESGRYWFSEQPTLRKVAEDRKAQVAEDREHLYAEIEKLLQQAPHNDRGDFARVHVAPHSPSEVSDEERVALVVLPPGEPHTRGDSDSQARATAKMILDSRGASPRLNKNMIIFSAADSVRLDELVDAVAWWLAWRSIVTQIDENSPQMTSVTQGQAEAARSDLSTAKQRIQSLIPETYRWMLLPRQPSPTERIELDEHQVPGDQPAAVRISRYLTRKQWLMPVMDGAALRIELDHIPLWDGDDIQVETLCRYFARHVYLPRVGSRETILDAIRNGVSSLTWNQQTFAWAREKQGSGENVVYQNLVAGRQLVSEPIVEGRLVKPEVAQQHLDRGGADGPRSDGLASGGTLDFGGGSSTQAPTAVGSQGGESREQPGEGRPKGSEHDETPKRRYFGTVQLDPTRASTQVGGILEEVISHLTATGASVNVTLDIEATHPTGFPERERKIVEKNSGDLRFSQSAFDDE